MRAISTTFQLVFWLFVLSACTSGELEDGDRDLVLKVEQLEPYGLRLPENYSSYESFKRERWIDGSVTIEYEFQAPEALKLPYLYSVAERHSSSAEACASYLAGNFGAPLGGVELSVRDDLFQFGTKSRFALLMSDGQPVGNYFAMCRGKTASMIVIGGFYFDDGELWGELLNPTLDAITGNEKLD